MSAIPVPSETELIDACTKGEPIAQKTLYDRYADRMRILCYRYIPVREDAQEAMMNGFYRFFKNIRQFSDRGEHSLQAWLTKIMINECLSHLRKKIPQPLLDLETIEDSGINEEVLSSLSAKEILSLIHALPDGYRTVFNLYFFEDKTVPETAQLLGISANTVKSQLRKAKAALQKNLLKRQLY